MSPCHHSVAHPQVVDEGTASNMKGSCKYIELAVTNGWSSGLELG